MNIIGDHSNSDTIPTLPVGDAALERRVGCAAPRENRTIPVVLSPLLFVPAGTTR